MRKVDLYTGSCISYTCRNEIDVFFVSISVDIHSNGGGGDGGYLQTARSTYDNFDRRYSYYFEVSLLQYYVYTIEYMQLYSISTVF